MSRDIEGFDDKKLKREVAREELTRLEESARSESEFEYIIEWWNRLDGNRARNERRNEYLMSDEMLDWNTSADDNFIDTIYCNPRDLHHLVEDADISRLIKNSTGKQKAVFFPHTVRGCTTTKISVCHCMTDRNVRKLCDLMLENIRCELYVILKERVKTGEPLTMEQKRFLARYKPKIKDKIRRSVHTIKGNTKK